MLNLNDVLSNRQSLKNNSSWKDYKFQLQNRIHATELEKYFILTRDEKIGIEKTIRLNVGTTPYYLMLADPENSDCPIRKTIIPASAESILSPEETPDPLHEERLSPIRGLTRMYRDRVLLFTSFDCSVFCRHCMRGRKVSYSEEQISKETMEQWFQYILENPNISDVVISGGDPLNLSDSKIEYILENLEKIPNVKICRIGTRNPVTLPYRITDELCRILEKYNTDRLSIFCNTQFNHEKECTSDAKEAVLKLLKAGINIGNQCVILKDINDSGEKMLALHKKLLELRIRAYYMYDPELIPGSRHIRTPLMKGFEILEYMRGKIGGMGIPHFVSDLPGGGGKVTMTPDWYLGFHRESRNHVFRSAAHGTYHLSPEPISSEYDSIYKEVDLALWNEIKKNVKKSH